MGRAIEMIAILRQTPQENRIFLYSKKDALLEKYLASLPPENFAECYGQDLLERIWKERRIEVVEAVLA